MSDVIDLQMSWDEFSGLSLKEKGQVYAAHKSYLGKDHAGILLGKTWAIYCGLESLPRLDGDDDVPPPSGEDLDAMGRALGKALFVYRKDVNVSPA